MNKLWMLVGVAALAACARAPEPEFGGTGQTNRGQPVSGTIAPDPDLHQVNIILQNPNGWTCTASQGALSTNRRVYTAPLTCSDGMTGRLRITASTAVVTFDLSNKEAGQIRMGPLK